MGPILTGWSIFLGLGFLASLEALVRPEVALAGKFALVLCLLIAGVIAVAALFCFMSIWFLDRMGTLWTYRFPRWKVAWHLLRTQSATETASYRWFRSIREAPSRRKLVLTIVVVAGTALGLSQLNPSTTNPLSGLVELEPRPWVPGLYAVSCFAALIVATILTIRVGIYRILGTTKRWPTHLLAALLGGAFLGLALKTSIAVPVLELFGLANLGAGLYGLEAGLGTGVYLVTVGLVWVLIFLLARLIGRNEGHTPILKIRRRLTVPTFIATVGIAVGVWALIVVLSVMEGFGDDLRSKILQVDAHVHVESQQLDRSLPNAPKLVRDLRSLKESQSVHPMVIGRAMITTDLNTSSSVDIKGIDPFTYGENALMKKVLPQNLLERLRQPESLLPDHLARRVLRESDSDAPSEESGFIAPSRIFPGILLGSELASSLGVQTGDRVQVISPEGDESPFGARPRTRSFRVAGTFHSGMYQYDLRLAYITYWDAAKFFHVEEGPNHLEIVALDQENIEPILSLAKTRLSKDLAAIRSWQEMNQALLSALELERIAMFLVLGFIVLVASFNIIGSLVLVIVEKAREIAILRAMGSSGRWVGHVFLNVGAFIGVIGIGTGLLLGLATCHYIKIGGVALPRDYYLERMPVKVDPTTVFTIAFIAVIVVLLSTLFPTLKASRLTPTEGLRNE